MRKIAIANQKGGVAKSTTATTLAHALHQSGHRVLFIDADPQCNTTRTYGATTENVATLYDVLIAGCAIEDAVQHTPHGDVLPGDPLLANADRLLTEIGKECLLRRALRAVDDTYDFAIIDTPPSLGVLLVNALTAADAVLVPVPAEEYAVEGLDLLMETVDKVREFTNPTITVEGLLQTRCTPRTKLFREMRDTTAAFANQYGTRLFETYIRECNAVKTAQRNRQFLLEAAPNSTAAQDYRALVAELVKGGI